MGCDIHMMIEYRMYERGRPNAFGGELRIPRNYRLFGHIAGVRGDSDPVVPPRGWRTLNQRDMSYSLLEQMYYVGTPPEDEDAGAHSCTPEVAARWVQSGYSVPLTDERQDGSYTYVTSPDAHTPGWLTADELGEVISRYSADEDEERVVGPTANEGYLLAVRGVPQLMAAYQAMRVLSDAYGADRVWINFWFDN